MKDLSYQEVPVETGDIVTVKRSFTDPDRKAGTRSDRCLVRVFPDRDDQGSVTLSREVRVGEAGYSYFYSRVPIDGSETDAPSARIPRIRTRLVRFPNGKNHRAVAEVVSRSTQRIGDSGVRESQFARAWVDKRR